LTTEIASRSTARRIEALDYEADFVAALVERNKDPRAHAQQGDACKLPFGDNEVDSALSMLVLHFVSDAQSAINEMRRVLGEGGIAAATVWDTAAALEPTASVQRVVPMTRPSELRSGFEKAGFISIRETLLTIQMDFESFED
jgi:ubiquinone/menaquinone biosynthesis C-methylase UbiE